MILSRSAVLLSLSVISACGGGGRDAPTVQTGVFVDAPVAGLRYATVSQAGLTDGSGTFRYLPGEVVQFRIGDILLGAADGKAVVTPFELIPGADARLPIRDNPPGVTNIARLLATLDADHDPRNGFTISEAARTRAAGVQLNFNQSIEQFAANGGPAHQYIVAAAPAAANGRFVSVAAAQAALQELANQMRGGGNPNQLPVASAGTDLAVDEETQVTLNGSGTDSDGEIIAYDWSQTAGIPVTLDNPESPQPKFTAPQVSGTQELRFELIVVDDALGRSAPSAVTVTVRDTGGNKAPVADAGEDQSVEGGAAVTLSGKGSDVDGTVVAYRWTQIDGPAVTLADADQPTARFTAPVVNVDSPLGFRLTVTDNRGASGVDFTSVTVRATTPANQPPQAFAGLDQTVNEGAAVTLAGTGSDEDGDVVAFAWTQIAGPAVELSGANTATAGFTAPPVEINTTLTFRLTVTDDDSATGTDEVDVVVRDVPPELPALSIDDASAAEADGEMIFTVRLNPAANGPVVVSYATADGSAVAGADYQARAGQLEFSAGETEQTITVPVLMDLENEPAETFTVTLTAPSGATLADAVATGTITNSRPQAPVCPAGEICAGAAKRVVTPAQTHIDGVDESRLGGSRVQKFNLGGFGINPFQNFASPPGANFNDLSENLTQPAQQRVYSGGRGEEHIWLRVMVLQQAGGQRVAFIALDAVGAGNVIQKGLTEAVRARSAALGAEIPVSNILFGQTHTHAGPDLQGLWGGVPQEWIQNILYAQAADAVQEALLNQQAATLTLRQGQNLDLNNYRRPRVDPHADADGTLTLLHAQTKGQNPTPIGSLLQYNAHPVSINESPRIAHADYILGALEWLEAANTGYGGVALYFNGPIADASGSGGRAGCTPIASDGAYATVRCRGEGMAHSAQSFAPRALAPTLSVRGAEVVLPVTNPLFVAAGAIGAFNRYYDFAELPVSSIPVLGDAIKGQMVNLPQLTPTARTRVTRITLGGADGLEIVTIPGEATNTFGQYIRSLAPGRAMMLLGLTQNSLGYILPEEEFNYIDSSGEAGLIAPFTGYEEFVSLGPLTAPMLRLQGYNPLFELSPSDPRNLPPSLLACSSAPQSYACLTNRVIANIDYIQRSYAQTCRKNGGPEAFCALLDPETPAEAYCRENGGSDALCRAFGNGGGGNDLPVLALDAQLRGCDLLDPAHCLLPFPSDHFTAAAAPNSPQGRLQGGTGRRVNFNTLAMPRNIAGKPIDPTEWNRNDGFSPGQMIVTYVPKLGVVRDAQGRATGPVLGAPPLTDLSQSLTPDASIMVLEVPQAPEAATPRQHPIWAEIDLNAGFLLPADGVAYPNPLQSPQPALLIRPAVNFREGRRYVVVLRKLRDQAGQPIRAQTPFATCRDGAASSLPPVSARCQQLQQSVFPVLQSAGIGVAGNQELYLAWDFTVGSARNQTARLRHMRDQAFVNGLGDVEDSNGTVLRFGRAPAFTVDQVTVNPQTGIAKRIEGTITVPSFVQPADPSPAEDPAVSAVLDRLRREFPAQAAALFDVADIGRGGSAPPNRLHYRPGDGADPTGCAGLDPQVALSTGCALQARYGDGLPDSTGDMTTRYICQIPAQASGGNPARPGVYGHGLLDGRSAVTYDAVPDFSREHNFMFCAVDLFGFAQGDLPNVASVLADLSNFPVIPDASQQGLLNYMFLARLLTHPQGFAIHPEFQKDGLPLFDRREVFYDGNSQGGIIGGVVLAMSKDLNRGVLGVPGMNYSTLLRRSVDFDNRFNPPNLPPYALPLYLAYQNDLDRDLAFSLMQMLWDRSENNGYAHHLTDNSALKGPDNQVLLHPAFADHQVTHWSAQVMARTLKVSVADLYARKPGEGVTHQFATRDQFFATRDPDEKDFYGLPLVGRDAGVAYDEPCSGEGCSRSTKSAFIEYDEGRTATPPIGNVPPRADEFDPHQFPRRTIYGRCQKSHFLHPQGRIIDVRASRNVVTVADCPALPAASGAPLSGTDPAALGITGAVADFFAGLDPVVAALTAGNLPAAGSALNAAVVGLTGDVAAILQGHPGLTAVVGDSPTAMVQRELQVDRSVEAVVLSGAQLPAWSVPPAQGVPMPYPSGANLAQCPDQLPQQFCDGLSQFTEQLGFSGTDNNAHNGVMVYPAPGTPAPMGTPVQRIAAWRWSGTAFVEIPVQVDQRYPYFLANPGSSFSIYSGTDEELNYEWDVERWSNADPNDPLARYLGAMPDPVTGLDHDDEIAFMYRDAGTAAAPGAVPADPDFDPAGGLQVVTLHDPLNPGLPKFVYLGLKREGKAAKFAGQPHYVHYLRDENADQWIDRHFFRDEDPEKLGTSNTGYGVNRKGKVGPGAAYYGNPGACSGSGTGRLCDSQDRFPRDGVQVFTDTYRWYASGRWMVREINVTRSGRKADYGPDLIDRWKGRAFQQSPDSTISVVGFEDEQVNWEANSTLLGERCGPVRCMREIWGADSGTNVTKTEAFYRDAVAYRYRVRVHPIPPDGLYTSWDYNRSAMVPAAGENVPAGRYYTLLRPQGVRVDGVNDDVGQIDTVPPDPFTGMCMTADGPRAAIAGRCPTFFDAADPSFNLPLAFNNWEQVSGKGGNGSLVYLFELKSATGLANPLVVPYYRDDACLDDGTGDDPVPRPWPGEAYSDVRVRDGYAAMAGKPFEQLKCEERQGAYGAHGVHYFFTHDSDNAFILGKPNNEIDGQQWQFMVPTGAPANVGARYANTVRAPVVSVVVPQR
jgi:hypothetical protein